MNHQITQKQMNIAIIICAILKLIGALTMFIACLTIVTEAEQLHVQLIVFAIGITSGIISYHSFKYANRIAYNIKKFSKQLRFQ